MVERMQEAISVGKFPGKDVTLQQIKNLAKLAILYHLDPLMGEIMPYQHQPYITIEGRRRIDARAGNHPSITIAPMDVDTYNAYVRMGAITDGDIVVVGQFTDTRTGATVEATGRVLAFEAQGGAKRDHLPIVKWRLEMAWKRCEARGRKMLYGPVALPAGMDGLIRLMEEDDAETQVVAITAPVDVATGEIVEGTVAPSEVHTQPRGRPQACPVHNRPWAKMPDGMIGHPLDDGDPCYQDESNKELAAGPEDDTPAEPATTEEPDALQDLQTRLGALAWEWDAFQAEVLKMPWAEWVRLGGTTDSAWDKFETSQSGADHETE